MQRGLVSYVALNKNNSTFVFWQEYECVCVCVCVCVCRFKQSEKMVLLRS